VSKVAKKGREQVTGDGSVTDTSNFLCGICFALNIHVFALGSKWKRFSVYSVFCWVVPLLVIVPALVIEFSDLETKFWSGYGQHNRGFSSTASLLLFVIAPLCVVMSLNVVFSSWSSYLIYSTKFKIKIKSTSRSEFCLFAKLALIMGLTWLTD
jgi:hypothetical protein